MPKILDISYAGELGAANYILGIRDGKAVRFPIEVFEDEPIVNSSFTVLTDTPANYVDQAGKLVAVNTTETALEFVDPPEGEYAFTDLTDTPNTYTDQGGKLVKVNSGGTGLEFGDAPASTFLGLSDTPDSYSTYSGKVVAVKADASGLEFVSASGGSYTIVDLTSATEDYTLSPGEVAKISYTSATSVPLHIATEEGEYEVSISGSLTTAMNTPYAYLQPNNTALIAARLRREELNLKSTEIYQSYIGTATGFYVGSYIIVASKFTAKTHTGNKITTGECVVSYATSNDTRYNFTCVWDDITTAWTSLGTVSFGSAQSGVITIRRII